MTSDRFLELNALPARIAMVGGGYVAAEFSHLAARAGAHVTVLQRAERMLPAFDPDVVGWLMEKFGELGIDVRTRSTVRRIEKVADSFLVHSSADGAADYSDRGENRDPGRRQKSIDKGDAIRERPPLARVFMSVRAIGSGVTMLVAPGKSIAAPGGGHYLPGQEIDLLEAEAVRLMALGVVHPVGGEVWVSYADNDELVHTERRETLRKTGTLERIYRSRRSHIATCR